MVAETMPATSDAVPLLGTRSVVIINDYDGGDPFGYPKPRPKKQTTISNLSIHFLTF
jgi:hypothetical protein